MESEVCKKHNYKVIYICLNASCNQSTFNCPKCMKENIHLDHQEDLKFIEILFDEIIQETELNKTINLLKNRIDNNSRLKTIIIDYFDSIINKDLETLKETQNTFTVVSAQLLDQIKSLSQENAASKSKILGLVQSFKSKNIGESLKLSSHYSACANDFIEKIKDERFLNTPKINFDRYNTNKINDTYFPEVPVIVKNPNKPAYSQNYSYIVSPFYEKGFVRFSIKAWLNPGVKTSCGIGIFKSLNINDIKNSQGYFLDFFENSVNLRPPPLLDDIQIIDIELKMDSKIYEIKIGNYISRIQFEDGKYQILILLGKTPYSAIKKIEILY